MGNGMKITPPRSNHGNPKGGWRPKMRNSNPKRKLWIHGITYKAEGQQLQSPVRQWSDMSEEERQQIRDRLGVL